MFTVQHSIGHLEICSAVFKNSWEYIQQYIRTVGNTQSAYTFWNLVKSLLVQNSFQSTKQKIINSFGSNFNENLFEVRSEYSVPCFVVARSARTVFTCLELYTCNQILIFKLPRDDFILYADERLANMQ